MTMHQKALGSPFRLLSHSALPVSALPAISAGQAPVDLCPQFFPMLALERDPYGTPEMTPAAHLM